MAGSSKNLRDDFDNPSNTTGSTLISIRPKLKCLLCAPAGQNAASVSCSLGRADLGILVEVGEARK